MKYGQNVKPLSALRAYSGQLLWSRSDLSGSILAYSKGVVCNSRIVDGESGDPALDKSIPLPIGSVYWSAIDKDIYYAVLTDGGKNTLFAYDLTNNTTVYSLAGFDDDNALPGVADKNYFNKLSIVLAGGKAYSFCGSSVYCHNLSDGSKAWGPVKAPAAVGFLRRPPAASSCNRSATNSHSHYVSCRP